MALVPILQPIAAAQGRHPLHFGIMLAVIGLMILGLAVVALEPPLSLVHALLSFFGGYRHG